MALRNRVAGWFGLKNLGHLNGATARRPASEYKLGDRVGIFSILYLSDEEVILGLSGGVDSSVAAALIHRAIGDQLTCVFVCLLYTSPSPRDRQKSRMPSSA